MESPVYKRILNAKRLGKTHLAVLVDPDFADKKHLEKLVEALEDAHKPLIFVGGSLLSQYKIEETIIFLKENTAFPIVLFPGSIYQISEKADALLFLSLISGRNPELLIGQHVIAAPMVKSSGLETIPTGYMLIDGGRPTTASYISNSQPIPKNKPHIAAVTALAGMYLGQKLIYLDAGSGADIPVSQEMIKAVCNEVNLPVIVGGGVKNAEQALEASEAGASVVVVGNALEKNPLIIKEIAATLSGK